MLGGQGWTALVTEAPTGTCGVMPALVLLGSLLQPFWLPSLPNCLCTAWQLLCWLRCLFPDAYRCGLFKGMDKWLQAVE